MSATRPLILHVSALNDAEYDLYTSSLTDLAIGDEPDGKNGGHDDKYYMSLTVGVREARAWLRGRFSHVPTSEIDAILKMFCPNLGQTDSLSGMQFFAALRMVVHVESGKDLDRALAFVQAHPDVSSNVKHVSSATSTPTSRPPTPPRQYTPHPGLNPPPTPKRRTSAHSQPPSQGPRQRLPSSASSAFSDPPPTRTNPFSPTNPSFSEEQTRPPQPPFHSMNPHNPFVPQSTSSIRETNSTQKLPPLPPRKPVPPIPSQPISQSTLIPPPRHASLHPSASPPKSSHLSIFSAPPALTTSPSPSNSQSSSSAHLPNPKPKPQAPAPPPKPVHVTSTLMRQSLQASKTAAAMKKAEEQLEQERVWKVLKSSSGNAKTGISPNVTGNGVTATGRNRSNSPDEKAPPLPRRRTVNHELSGEFSRFRAAESARDRQPSPPYSNTSLEQVAGATLPFRYNASPFKSGSRSPSISSPSMVTTDLPTPPPTHPDRRPPMTSSSSDTVTRRHTRSHTQPDAFDMIYGQDGAATTQSQNESPFMDNENESPFSNANSLDSGLLKANMDSPTGRIFRSKSMHYASPSSRAPIPPPVRRKRPESVQITGGGGYNTAPFSSPGPGSSGTFPRSPNTFTGNGGGGSGGSVSGLSRHTSLSTSSSPSHRREDSQNSDSPFTGLQRTLATLQPKLEALQPKLDKARYKAEAGLSRKGYLNHSHIGDRFGGGVGVGKGRGMWREEGEEGLMDDYGDEGDVGGVDADSVDVDSASDDDVRDGDGDSRFRRNRAGGGGRGAAEIDQDNLKWPVQEGEGWKPL